MQFIPVDTANHQHFIQISSGTKKLITRHNTEYADGLYYKDSKVGDLLKVIDTKTKDTVFVKVAEIKYFRNLDELFKSKLANDAFNKVFRDKNELSNEYEKNRPGYAELLEKDGVVVWKINRQ